MLQYARVCRVRGNFVNYCNVYAAVAICESVPGTRRETLSARDLMKLQYARVCRVRDTSHSYTSLCFALQYARVCRVRDINTW